MKTLFVVAEPKSQSGPALISPHDNEKDARDEFHATISDGLASLEVGQYLVRLDNVTPELYSRLVNETNDVVDSKFAGFDAEVLEFFGASVDQWLPGSLTTGNTDEDNDFDSSDEDYRVF